MSRLSRSLSFIPSRLAEILSYPVSLQSPYIQKIPSGPPTYPISSNFFLVYLRLQFWFSPRAPGFGRSFFRLSCEVLPLFPPHSIAACLLLSGPPPPDFSPPDFLFFREPLATAFFLNPCPPKTHKSIALNPHLSSQAPFLPPRFLNRGVALLFSCDLLH